MKIETRLSRIISEVEALPTETFTDDLFAPTNHKNVMLPFFISCLAAYLRRQDFKCRIKKADLVGAPYDIFLRLNSPQSPVRNGLILLSIDDAAPLPKKRNKSRSIIPEK